MSKSRGNLVRLSDELADHGVDAVRLTMVFAGPPGGRHRLGRRVARRVGEVPGPRLAAVRRRDERPRRGRHDRRRGAAPGDARTPSHEATRAIETFRFNVAVARVMELVNATRKAIDAGPGPADPAVREAAEAVAILLSLFAPYTAEEMWERLGHEPTVALAGWPAVDEALLVEETVTCVVQVAGKVRDRLEVPPDIAEDALRELALASDAVQRALDGRAVRTVVVRAPKLVNVVPA